MNDRKYQPALRTRVCELFGIAYPIVQTGMGWVSGSRLVAATSQAGGLGILASATMSYVELEQAIREVRERTDRPFGVNLRAEQTDLRERVDLLCKSGVRVASFASPPTSDTIKRLKDGGVLSMPTVGARRHAEKMAQAGADALIAQGHEGGGHTGPVPTTLLLPQVAAAVDIPVLGAGGFLDGRGLVAALAYGASGIAMGTRFLLTQESPVPDDIKRLYVATPVTGTVVTRAIDGRPQRVIRTALVDGLEQAGRARGLARAVRHAWRFRSLTGIKLPHLLREAWAMRNNQELSVSQLLMAANAPMLTRASMVEGRSEVGILPTGQVVGLIEEIPTVAAVIAGIMAEADKTLERLCACP